MSKRSFSIVYWNLWLEMQNGKRDTGRRLTEKLNFLVNKYEPEFIGLNELVIDAKTGRSCVKEHLEKLGYNLHFTPFSNISDDLVVGNALAYRPKPRNIAEHVLGPDTQAQRRGYPDQTVSLIHGEFAIADKPVSIIVNYLGNLIPLDWGTHATHRRNFNKYLSNLNSGNVIIGGDFNEPKYLWPWLKLPGHYRRLTGGIFSPTWRLLGRKSLLIAANYDYILYDKSQDLRMVRYEVLDRSPSDHSPLYARFEI